MAVTIKSPREIELMREAGRILAKTHEELAKNLRPGMSTWDIDHMGEEIIRSYGCIPSFKNYNGYPASICVSVNDEVVHGIPHKEHFLDEGDIVSLDAGANALADAGVACKEYSAADTNEISTVCTTAIGECDVLYLPTDNTMASSTETIKNIVVPAGIPVIAGEEGICRGCGVATLSISYEDLGRATGEMAYEILVEGADISTMDVRFAPNVTKKYNASICAELGITAPEGYEAIAE